MSRLNPLTHWREGITLAELVPLLAAMLLSHPTTGTALVYYWWTTAVYSLCHLILLHWAGDWRCYLSCWAMPAQKWKPLRSSRKTPMDGKEEPLKIGSKERVFSCSQQGGWLLTEEFLTLPTNYRGDIKQPFSPHGDPRWCGGNPDWIED